MKAAIFIDDWKLPIFERSLTHAGYTYEVAEGRLPLGLVLTVTTDDIKSLETVVRAANTEAAVLSDTKGAC